MGVTLIYGILRFSNFAHGDTMAFGAMVTILITWCDAGGGDQPSGRLPTALLALPFGILGCIALLLVSDRLVYSFYREQKAKPVILVIVSMGVMFIYEWADPFHHWPRRPAFCRWGAVHHFRA